MKVVLFCGGLGLRIRDNENVPKPMVTIGYRPILWHVMKYYAHYGHKDFVLCLGHRGDAIKNYFLNYSECVSNDFTLSDGGKTLDLMASDIHDWRITFVDTGLNANIGQRLKAVQHYLGDDPAFLANYSDALTDLPLADYIKRFHEQDKLASFICVTPSQSFHTVSLDGNGLVDDIKPVPESGLLINGGFFVFKREFFDYLKDGEELVREPFHRLIGLQQLAAYRHQGFWMCMDTFKDKQAFDDMEARGDTPWQVWRLPHAGRAGDA